MLWIAYDFGVPPRAHETPHWTVPRWTKRDLTVTCTSRTLEQCSALGRVIRLERGRDSVLVAAEAGGEVRRGTCLCAKLCEAAFFFRPFRRL